jgi:hypothetical protein
MLGRAGDGGQGAPREQSAAVAESGGGFEEDDIPF